ncbi:MAG: Crp/Fnr family transcriptional regulator [Acidobacteria bacterium]|jgi:CRP/FNR family transcriptional regulator|nr:Crp/Fnr family transcriptional regulator [Acidobacteriota bacterium]
MTRATPPSSGARPLACPAGTVLFRPDDTCAGFVVLAEGCIRVSLTSPGGREIVLYRVQPGDVCLQTFTCLAEGRVYSAEGVAETELKGELIPPAEYERRLAEDPDFRRRVFMAVAHRFADFEHLVESLASASIEARLAEALLARADAQDDVHLTHDALAAEIGSAREVVSRQLARFERAGLVGLSRGKVTLRAKSVLQRKAAGSVT